MSLSWISDLSAISTLRRRQVKTLLYVLFAVSAALGSPAAHAVDGCKVLLCLAGNWKNISECRPDVEEALHQVERGKGLPSCDMAGAGNMARVVSSYYDPCPDGTTALAPGLTAVQGTSYAEGMQLSTGIGTGDDQAPRYDGGDGGGGFTPLPGKVCVGQQTGSQVVQITTGSGTGDGADLQIQTLNVGFYDRVVLMDPLANPRAIDVFVNSALYRRVRW